MSGLYWSSTNTVVSSLRLKLSRFLNVSNSWLSFISSLWSYFFLNGYAFLMKNDTCKCFDFFLTWLYCRSHLPSSVKVNENVINFPKTFAHTNRCDSEFYSALQISPTWFTQVQYICKYIQKHFFTLLCGFSTSNRTLF